MCHPPTHVRAGRYRTRTAAEPTAACGGNREARLGPRSDFSRPRQGAVEKSVNATRQGGTPQIQLLGECLPRKLRLPEHRLQNLGLCSTGQEQCKSEPFVKNKGRVSPWRWYPAFFASGMVFRLAVWYTRLNKSEFTSTQTYKLLTVKLLYSII